MNKIIEGLTIQEVADKFGISAHTLRYYERIGLLAPINRADNGHRRYSEEDIARVRSFVRLRATGMSIQMLQSYAVLLQQPDSWQERFDLLESHAAQLKAQIGELEQDLQLIQDKLTYYKEKIDNENPSTGS